MGGFATERHAKDVRDDARVKARRREYVDRSRITVAAYLGQWLDDHEVESSHKRLAAALTVPEGRVSANTPSTTQEPRPARSGPGL